MLVCVKETFVWEVQSSAFHVLGVMTRELFIRDIVHEVMVVLGIVVEEVHIQIIIVNKGACNERFWEVGNWNCEVVDSNLVIDHKFAFLDFSLSSASIWFSFETNFGFFESTEFEYTIIDKCQSKFSSICILFNFFHLDV